MLGSKLRKIVSQNIFNTIPSKIATTQNYLSSYEKVIKRRINAKSNQIIQSQSQSQLQKEVNYDNSHKHNNFTTLNNFLFGPDPPKNISVEEHLTLPRSSNQDDGKINPHNLHNLKVDIDTAFCVSVGTISTVAAFCVFPPLAIPFALLTGRCAIEGYEQRKY
jgi:hypothetical protein